LLLAEPSLLAEPLLLAEASTEGHLAALKAYLVAAELNRPWKGPAAKAPGPTAEGHLAALKAELVAAKLNSPWKGLAAKAPGHSAASLLAEPLLLAEPKRSSPPPRRQAAPQPESKLPYKAAPKKIARMVIGRAEPVPKRQF
jgi:hypothetical protein